MSMKGQMGMMLAMAGMFGLDGISMPEKKEKQRPVSKILPIEERIEKFKLELGQHNAKSTNFPKWKLHYIDGIPVIASNLKNAHKKLNFLLASNGLVGNDKEAVKSVMQK